LVQVQQLRHDQVRHLVVDGRTKKDNALLEEQRIDVIGALAAAGRLDYHRNDISTGLNASISAGSIVGPVSATAGFIQALAMPTTVTAVWPNTLGIALQNGSTNAVIEVLLQINNAVLTR